MALRTALRRSPWITFALLLASLWILLTGLRVFGAIDLSRMGTLGQGAISGIVGLLVIALALGLLVVLFGELSEPEPGPDPWPPSE